MTVLASSCSRDKSPDTSSAQQLPNCSQIKQISSPSQELSLPCLNSQQLINLQAVKGPALVNVWGSWCEPCKEEIPFLKEFHSRSKGKVSLYGIDIEESSKEVGKAFAQHYGMLWPHLFDQKSRSRIIFGMGVPTTLFVNNRGRTVHIQSGPYKSTAEIYQDVKDYLGINLDNSIN